MKTLLIPLDERPCNYNFPQMIVSSKAEIELCIPSQTLLGDKKKPANTNMISRFLKEYACGCDNLIISIDMLIYGGLIPSRLHHCTKEDAMQRLKVIQDIKKTYPNIKIYAFHCIMRAPSYNSSEEEPDYYEKYGYDLFRRAYLANYKERHGLTDEQQTELNQICIPLDIIEDYEKRRDFNTMMNLEVIEYLAKGYIDFLVIPQDDSSPYGYTAISQKRVVDEVKAKHLEQKVMIYPGADEVAMSLLARAYHEYNNIEPKVYPFYASVLGPTLIPKYEDRPMLESLKSHIRVCKAKIVQNVQDADIILAINAPGKVMQEAFVDKSEQDISYTSYRQLLDFAYQIQDYVHLGYQVALCDSAFSNGGDYELIQYLDDLDVLEKLISYAGWNTNCNSLGTCLSQAFLSQKQNYFHLCYRLIEDVFYQSLVRKEVIDKDLIELGLSYYDFKNKQNDVEDIIKEKLQTYYNSLKISRKYPTTIVKINMPWHRMFEIGMEIVVNKNA
jgi:hypothetical protein